MPEHIPGTRSSPFSKNGKLHPKSTLHRMVTKWELDRDPAEQRDNIIRTVEDNERSKCETEARLRGLDVNDSVVRAGIEAQAERSGFEFALGFYGVQAFVQPITTGRPQLCGTRCLIALATLIYEDEDTSSLSHNARCERTARVLGPGIRAYHVEYAVRRAVELHPHCHPLDGTEDELRRAEWNLRLAAADVTFRETFTFLAKEAFRKTA